MNEDTIFIANDLDLNKVSKEELQICCEYNLLIKTDYPKLITFLFFNDNFQKWLISNNININNKEVIFTNLINAIKHRTITLNNETPSNTINLNKDKHLWNLIVEEFLSNDEELLKKKQKSNTNIIIRRKKSLKKINSNKELLITI
jgi:hypothetical protein